jgi:hypothetical protein
MIVSFFLCHAAAADFIQECITVNHEYALARDHGDIDAYGRLFADEAVFFMEGEPFRGKAAILDRLSGGESESFARLLISTVNITDNYDGTASGIIYFTMFQAPVEDSKVLPITSYTIFMGEYHDTYLQTEQGCKILRRETTPTFIGNGTYIQ